MIQCKICGKRASDGFAIYRTSPKGQDFEGVCKDHREVPVPEDDIANIIENANSKSKVRMAT